MNNITTDLIFPSLLGNGPDKAPTDNYDPTLKVFEEMVDRIVSKDLKDKKAEEQAAVEKAKMVAERQREMAFLSGAVQQAEVALQGMPSSSPRPLDAAQTLSVPNEVEKAVKESQLLYWKAKLIQAGIPDGTMGPL